MRSSTILASLLLAGVPAFTACVVGDDTRDSTDLERVAQVPLAPAAAPPPLLWSANLESYLPFTVLDPATHGGSLVPERFLTWPASSLRLTALPVVPGSLFKSARVLLADGLLPDADPSPPLTFGAFDGTRVPPVGGGNGSDVLVLGFDAYFEALSGSTVNASVSLTTTTGGTDNRVTGLVLPTRQLLHATVVVNRSGRPVRLPDFDADGEIDAEESLAPDHATAYFRKDSGAYALAGASAAAQPIAAALYTRVSWHLAHGNVSLALYDDFLLASSVQSQVNGRPVLELMPQGLTPPADPAHPSDPADQPADVEIEYGDEVETFEPVISKQQSRSLREGFQWSATTPWPEGTDDAPALFYAMLYVTDPEQRAVLDEMGVHWDALPLFSGEMDRYDGRVGVFEHDPDDLGGHWVFALLPGGSYNVIRDEALAGNAVFDAVLRRDVPEAGATAADGSLRYEWLAGQGLHYAPDPVIDPVAPAPPAILKPEYVDDQNPAPPETEGAADGPQTKRLGRRLRRIAKKVVDKTKDLVNKGREKLSDAIETVAPEVKLDIDLVVLNRDPDFDPEQPMARAWEPDIGQPLSLPGIEVRVRQGKILLNRPRLNRDGSASTHVIKGLKTDICLVMSNHAAELTTLLIETRICDFSGHKLGRVRGDRDVHLRVRQKYTNVLAQMTDAYEYMKRVEGAEMHRATVLVGWLADRLNGGASYAPCFDFFNSRLRGEGVVTDFGLLTLDAVLTSHGVPALGPLVWAAEALTGVDIVILADDSRSRLVPTHEYGHFAMCSLMASESNRLFSNVNADIIHKTSVPGGREQGPDVLAINEGFADYIASQVAGGYNYWKADWEADDETEVRTGHRGIGAWYCAPSSPVCADDNIGGTLKTEQLAPKNGRTKLNQTLNFKAAQVSTYMADAADGDRSSGDHPNDGAAFRWFSGHFSPDAAGGTTNDDEPVALGRGWLRKLIEKLADRRHNAGVSWRLDRPEFFKPLNDMVKAASDRRTACNLCELHLDNQFCDAAGYATFACTTYPLTARVTGVGTVTSSTGGQISRDPMSCHATDGVCTADYEKDRLVTVRATPATGQHFVRWGGACSGTATTCTVTMSAARTVTARFEGDPVMATVTVVVQHAAQSSGTITSRPTGINCRVNNQGTCTKQVQVGSRFTLVGSTADSDWMNWRGACQGSHEYECAFEVTGNITVTGTFETLL